MANHLNPPYYLITILAPDIFGSPATRNIFSTASPSYYEYVIFVGIAAFMFALISVFFQRRDTLVRFYFIAAIVSIFLSLNFLISKLVVILPIPFLSTAIPNRILFLSTFSLSVLSAFGLNTYLKLRSFEKRLKLIIFLIAFIYLVTIFHLAIIILFKLPYFEQETYKAFISLRNLVLPILIFSLTSSFLFLGIVKKALKTYCVLAIVALSIFHIFFFAHKYFSFSERKFIYPDTEIITFIKQNQGYFRSLSLTSDKVLSNTLSQYRIYYPEGYDPGTLRDYADFIAAMRGSEVSPKSRTAVEFGAAGNLEKFIGNESNKKILNLMGVKYLFSEKSKEEYLKDQGFNKVFEDRMPEGFAIFENPNVLPRVFLASHFESINPLSSSKDDKTTLTKTVSRILDSDFRLEDSVIINEAVSGFSPEIGEWKAEILSYEPNEVLIKTKSDVAKVLFLSDNYYPGWKAAIDGQQTEILRGDYTFRAIFLPAGEHIVKFYFDSLVFRTGLLVLLISLVSLYLFYFRKR